MTRQELRYRIARQVEGKDGFVLGAVDSSSVTTIVDASLIEPDKAYDGWYIHFHDLNALPRDCRIRSSSSSGVLTCAENFVTQPAAGTGFELHKYFEVQDFNDAIRDALVEAGHTALLRTDSAAVTLVSTRTVYDIPPGMTHIYAVEVAVEGSQSDHVHRVAPAAWSVVRASRTVRLHPSIPQIYGGQVMYLRGLRPPALPSTDDAEIELFPDFVVFHAAAALARQNLHGGTAASSDAQGWTTRYQAFLLELERERANLYPAVPNNTRRVD